MMYYDKKECYEDVYLSLMLGVLAEEDIRSLLDHYGSEEHYECCAGIVQAYRDYKKNKEEQYEN